MSFFRKHVRGLLRQTFARNGSSDADSEPNCSEEEGAADAYADPSNPNNNPDSALVYERVLNGRNGRKLNLPEIYSGKTGLDLPVIQLDHLDQALRAAFTGPDGGLMNVSWGWNWVFGPKFSFSDTVKHLATI